MRTTLPRLTWRPGAIGTACVFIAALVGCGGGTDEDDQAASPPAAAAAQTQAIEVVATKGDDGWQLGVWGVRSSDVLALRVDSVDFMPLLRQKAGSAAAHILDIKTDEGHAFLFGSMRQPSADGFPLTGHVLLETTTGARLSASLSFIEAEEAPTPQAADLAPTASALGIVDWVWKKAVSMAKSGIASAVIKAFMKKNGYICPPVGPWFLCGRPAG